MEEVFAEHTRWASIVKERHSNEAIFEYGNSKDRSKRLKIGYLSPDLCTHTVALYSEVLLKHRDKEKYHVTVYFCREREDEDAGRLGSYVDRWVNVYGLGAGQAAKLIHSDEIDILVELTGHTANNRSKIVAVHMYFFPFLLLFHARCSSDMWPVALVLRLDILACRPAPIQVTWIGYPNTTGLDYIHYRVTDALTDPVDTDQPFAEKLIRLPDNFLCFTPHPATPDVQPPPFEANGWVTFGSFNSLGKVQVN